MLDPLVVNIIFVILIQNHFKHVIKVIIFLVRLSHSRAWFLIRLSIYSVNISLLDDPFSNRDDGPCWIRFWLVLEVAECSFGYLDIARNKIDRYPWLKFHDFPLENYIVFTFLEKLMRGHWHSFPVGTCFEPTLIVGNVVSVRRERGIGAVCVTEFLQLGSRVGYTRPGNLHLWSPEQRDIDLLRFQRSRTLACLALRLYWSRRNHADVDRGWAFWRPAVLNRASHRWHRYFNRI